MQIQTSPSSRAAASRANSQHSTGPNTAAGKAVSRFNAIQHGLYSEVVVLPNENHEEFENFTRSLIHRYGPQTDHERELIQTLRNTQWRINRILTLESGIIALATEDKLDLIRDRFEDMDEMTAETLAQSAGYLSRARELDQLSRHEARLIRQRDRAARELEAISAKRASRFVPPPTAPGTKSATPSPLQPLRPSVPAPPPPTHTASFVPSISSAPKPSAPQYDAPMPKFSGPQRKEHRKQWMRAHAIKPGTNSAA